MPSANRNCSPSPTTPQITRFTNCRVLRGNTLVKEDVWISSDTGKILNGQEEFYCRQSPPAQVIDLSGRILSPGFIDVQLNGAFGFNFSIEAETPAVYVKNFDRIKKSLVKTGVTSFLPTLTSQVPELYHKVSEFHCFLFLLKMLRNVGIAVSGSVRISKNSE
jgi:N-acetylglucosamine-6-phosphate deacetylase